jgi:hypothetical protein
VSAKKSADIVFSNLDKPVNEEEKEFMDTGNEFWVYSGRIPLWLGVSLTLSQVNQETRKKNYRFQVMRFLPQNQEKEIKGKTLVGILPTTLFSKENVVTLYRSGKLFLLDPTNITAAGTERIFSDIKAGSDAKAMSLLAEGILAMIIDRSVHCDCNEIELHLSYLPERYSALKSAFCEARDKRGGAGKWGNNSSESTRSPNRVVTIELMD